MRFRPARVRVPEWIVGAAALALGLDAFLLPWYRSADAWASLTVLRFPLLLCAAGGVLAWWFQGSRGAPAVPICAFSIELFLSSVLLIGLLVRVVIAPPAGAGAGDAVQAGAYLGLALCAAIAFGAYRSLRLDGIRDADGPAVIEVLAVER
jgi:hypothetical protein